jgi:thymidylate synthase (FAD)
MKVGLLHNSLLELAIIGARTCYNSLDKSDCMGEKDKALLRRLISSGHHSVIEHIVYTFSIKGISRALLQELARHRIASYSVKSTRYTLKELKNERFFTDNFKVKHDVLEKYCVYQEGFIGLNLAHMLEHIIQLLKDGFSNDQVKYLLPEAFKTELVMTINARSLRNLLHLRIDKRALKEFQELSKAIVDSLPKDHLILFEDILK